MQDNDRQKTTFPPVPGGMPEQEKLLTGRAVFKEAYVVIPRGVMTDIVTSFLPGWEWTRLWMLSRPLTGLAETFSWMLMELAPGGGSDAPEPEPMAEGILYVTHGDGTLTIDGTAHGIRPGSYAYVAAGSDWAIRAGQETMRFHWVRRAYVPASGIEAPPSFVTHENDHPALGMPDTEGRWTTTRFVEPEDLRHDMHVNIVSFHAGGVIPFEETHVMEHGLFVLQGRGVYKLNEDWVEVRAGDYLWLRAYCPQACYSAGQEPFRYLLYKDVNRHPPLALPGALK